MSANMRRLARRALDARLAPLQGYAQTAAPEMGWVRTIREALGLSRAELGLRMGISKPAVQAIERNDARSAVRIATLERAADAMDCDLLIAFVPRRGLERTVREQAERQVDALIARTEQTMSLEAQSSQVLNEERNELIERFIARHDLWTEVREHGGS